MNSSLFPRTWAGVTGSFYYLIQTLEQFLEFYQEAKKQFVMAVDTETNGLLFVWNQICGISIGWDDQHFYLPVRHQTEEKQLDLDRIKPYLIDLLNDPDKTYILANEKFDRHMLHKEGIEIGKNSHDIITMAHLLDENSSHAVKDMAVRFCHKEADKWEKVKDQWLKDEARLRQKLYKEEFKKLVPKGAENKEALAEQAIEFLKQFYFSKKGKDEVTWDYIPLEIISPYACADSDYTYFLFKYFLKKLMSDKGLPGLYQNEIEVTRLLYDVEEYGTKLDIPYLIETKGKLANQIIEIEKEIFTDLGEEINLNSDQQLIASLQKQGVVFTKLTEKSKEYQEQGLHEKVKFSIDKEVLDELALDYPIADKIKSRNGLDKLLNTYVTPMIAWVDKADFLHSIFNQNVVTGRLSSRSPNIQNIHANDKTIRRSFIIINGHVYVFIDFSQIELRLLSVQSKDPILLDCYSSVPNKDVHTLTTAEIVLAMEVEELLTWKGNKEGHSTTVAICECPACEYDYYRSIGKRVAFAIVFQTGPKTLSQQLSTPKRRVSERECKQYLERFFWKYQGVKDFIDQQTEFVRETGFVKNSFGRYRRLPDAKSVERWKRARAGRQAVNFLCQGEAADVMKYSATRVNKYIKENNLKTRMTNLVHDEFQFYVPEEELDIVEKIKDMMEDWPRYPVKLKTAVSFSTSSWASKVEIE